MRQASMAHVAAMAANARQWEAEAELLFGVAVPGAALPAVTVTGLGSPRISHPVHVADGMTSVPVRYAVLGDWRIGEPGWGLAPTDGGQQMGVWSDASIVGGVGGTLSTPVVITLTWPEPQRTSGVQLAADPRWPGVPLEWTVKAYLGPQLQGAADGVGSGHHQSAAFTQRLTCDRLEFTIVRWTQGERVRVVESNNGRTVRIPGRNLLGLSCLQELGTRGDALPAGEIAMEVIADDALLAELAPHMPLRSVGVSARLGVAGHGMLEMPLSWARRTKRMTQRRISIVAEDVVFALANRPFRGLEPTVNIAVGDLVRAILADMPQMWWSVDPVLDAQVLPWAALPAQAVRPALAALAEPLAVQHVVQDSGIIRFTRIDQPSSFIALTPADVYAASRNVDEDRLWTVVTVAYGPLELAPAAELARWEDTAGSSTVVSLEWDTPARNRTVAITGATLTSVIENSPTRWAGVISGSGPAIVSISGQVLRRVRTSWHEERDVDGIAEFGLRAYRLDSPLIQTQAQAQAVAQRLLIRQSELEVDWRGDIRIQPGDGVTWDGLYWRVVRAETSLGGMLRQRLRCVRVPAPS